MARIVRRRGRIALAMSSAAKIRLWGKHRRQDVAKVSGLLEIIGLQIGEGALVDIARIGGLRHLEAEEGRALGRIARNDEHGERRRQFAARCGHDARAHAGRGTAAVLAHGDLPDAALPGEETRRVASLAARCRHRKRLALAAGAQSWPRLRPIAVPPAMKKSRISRLSCGKRIFISIDGISGGGLASFYNGGNSRRNGSWGRLARAGKRRLRLGHISHEEGDFSGIVRSRADATLSTALRKKGVSSDGR